MSKDLQLIKSFVKKQRQQFTIGDAVTITGLPVLEARYALKELMKDYDCRLDVNEKGELLYDFGNKLLNRGRTTFSEQMKKVGAVLWTGFKWFFKACITVVLVVYFFVFIALLLALLLGLGSRDNGGGGKGGGIGNLIGGIFRGIFNWNTHHRTIYRPRDPWGYEYPHYEPRKTHLPHKRPAPHPNDPKNQRQEEKSYISSVYDFVFGPPRVPEDSLKNQRELASFLRDNKGVVSVSEVQALAGWTRDQAANFLTEGIALLDGEPEISENGTLIARFEGLLETGGGALQEDQEPVVYFWNEYVPEWELTGNKTSRNIMIIGVNLFNLVLAVFALSGGFAELVGVSFGVSALLGLFPLWFSTTFFLIPFIRSFYVKKKQQEQHVENIRRRLMHVIYRKHREQIPLKELVDTANRWRSTEEVLSPKVVTEVLENFVDDLKGEAGVNENAEVVYSFYRLNSELDDLENERQMEIGSRDPRRFLER